MSMQADVDSKDALRERFRAYRTQLAPETVASKSALIAERVWQLPEVQSARTVHCYWPMVERGEVDTRPLIDSLHDRGNQVVLPVMTTFGDKMPSMEHRCFTDPQAMCTNRWGLREPVDTELVSPSALDVVIVPALGAGRHGHRIGHGHGYYDAFLAPLDVPTIALVYDACLVDAFPADSHDVPVSIIVTEHDTLRPAAGAA
jgi:5-formyltetrahydrofolate cyclo-ligase